MVKRSRLKKKAWQKVTLYHVTNSDLFLNIVRDGQIVPGVYTDRATNGSGNAGVYMDLYNSSIHEIDQVKVVDVLSLSEKIEYDFDTGNYNNTNKTSVFTEGLLDKVVEIITRVKSESTQDIEGSLKNEIIEIIETKMPSGSNGVYLGTERMIPRYSDSLWSESKIKGYPIFSVALQIECDVDALGPDLDDGNIDERNNEPYWKQTLKNCQQCIHYGPINVDQIIGVMLMFSHMGREESRIFRITITKNSWLSFEEAVEQCNKFYQLISQSGEREEQIANIKSKLKKNNIKL